MNSKLSSIGLCLATALGLAFVRGAEPPQSGPATEKRFPPLKVPSGFKATLFACDPLVDQNHWLSS